MRFDLHVHTTASDGTLTPTEIVRQAAEAGLVAVAITDHDSIEGVQEALDAAAACHECITVIPGVELSAVHGGLDVHILGYFANPADVELRTHLSDLRVARLNRARAIVAALDAAGYHLPLDEVMDLSEGAAVGRSHVARALVHRGHAQDVSDAFKRLLGRGKPFYVPKDVRTPAEVLQVILDAGGVPVLAHPGVTGADDLIPELVASGLAGLEAYHAEHGPGQRQHYARLAAGHGLLLTGGTDYHGPFAPNPALGSVEMPDSVLPALFAAAGRSLPDLPPSRC
ncbi:MAG: PHP domain-containing protein [Anaerosomatales bacterium]|nr:PHP domain-containing protein [Anaerosomatales bacterium]MDT8433354.1 PHP domain-containing protein [Anaerosomatales bacterium]